MTTPIWPETVEGLEDLTFEEYRDMITTADAELDANDIFGAFLDEHNLRPLFYRFIGRAHFYPVKQEDG